MRALLATIASLPKPTQACRVFHGRGGLHPGHEQWALDFYPPVWLLTSFASVTDDELEQVGKALEARWAELAPGQPLNWVFQHRDEYRPKFSCAPSGGRDGHSPSLGGTENRLMAGSVPAPHIVTEHDARYEVKGSFVASKDYARVVRRLPDLIAPGGHALLALNAPELGPQFLLDLVQQEAPMFTLVERLANPPSFADVDEDRALKVLVFQRQAEGAAATSAA
ncbi:MAG: hypothetical protein C4K60_05335 [Ideonella sp. MAG2]|nr:MAG: hypothetical protein C4K60_05335 [Ideonella sp. MAG2]